MTSKLRSKSRMPLDPWLWVKRARATEDHRPMLRSLLIEDGVAIATNGHALHMAKVVTALPNGIWDIDALQLIEGTYPNWRGVSMLPEQVRAKGWRLSVHDEALTFALRGMNAAARSMRNWSPPFVQMPTAGEQLAHCHPTILWATLEGLLNLDEPVWMFCEGHHSPLHFAAGERYAVLMPVRVDPTHQGKLLCYDASWAREENQT